MNENTERLKPFLLDYIQEVTQKSKGKTSTYAHSAIAEQDITAQEHLPTTLIRKPTNALPAMSMAIYSHFMQN